MRLHQALSPAGRTAEQVRIFRVVAVIRFDELLRYDCRVVDGEISIIQFFAICIGVVCAQFGKGAERFFGDIVPRVSRGCGKAFCKPVFIGPRLNWPAKPPPPTIFGIK
jgi:hypothetical protein